ncbi:heparinase II/III domain-containing protein [Pseudactinotalea sp. Z1748]|uniref:heparinase II/III domain-containing protein n=1 Tax=Pseudactinotalea sp. Z1748 TaxID=3413027 RepID=UPI003C7D23E7
MQDSTTPMRALWGDRAEAPALRNVLRAPDQALPVAPATDRAVWDLGAGRLHHPSVTDLIENAQCDREHPWPHTLATLLADYVRADNRVGYEEQVFTRQGRLSRAVIAAAVTGEAHWLDDVADGLIQLCEQTTWCWPAHEESFSKRGWLLPDPDAPVLDLGAGEVVAQITWTDHLLGASLDEHFPGLRTRLRREARLRVLDPYLQRRDWWWIGTERRVNNWNPWICGNVALAALRLLDGPEEADLRARIVAQTIADADNFVDSLPADGAVDEGASYWWEGVGRLLEMLDVLHHATGGELDPGAIPAVGAALAYLHRMHLGRGWYVGVADSAARAYPGVPWNVPYRWAVRLGDDRARDHAAAQVRPGEPLITVHRRPTSSLGRILHTITDTAFAAAAGGAEASPEPAVWLPSVQMLVRHGPAQRERRLSLTIKGGHNGENHNHNDIGAVTVALNGVPVVVDAGRPTYTRQTFGPDRYQLWPMQSQWHSVPLIRGSGQRDGERYRARSVSVLPDDEAPRGMELDLAAAYPREDVRTWVRRAELGDGEVRVSDSWHLDAPDGETGPTRVHWILAGSVRLVEPGRATVTPVQGEDALELTWDPDLPAGLEVQELDDPMLTEVWGDRLTRLFIEVDTGTTGSTTMVIR